MSDNILGFGDTMVLENSKNPWFLDNKFINLYCIAQQNKKNNIKEPFCDVLTNNKTNIQIPIIKEQFANTNSINKNNKQIIIFLLILLLVIVMFI